MTNEQGNGQEDTNLTPQKGSERSGGEMADEGGGGKSKTIIIVLGFAVFVLLLAVIFLLSPLKETLFPSRAAPAITLEIMEDSSLDEETGLYRYLVEAVVTGYPSPEVLFNRNDGIGELERNQTLVLLAEGEVFLLKATASNTLGSADDTLELFAGEVDGGDEGEDEGDDEGNDEGDGEGDGADPGNGDAAAPANRPPIISGIDFSEDILYTGESYTVTARASDPDGDSLSYSWQFLSGTRVIERSTANPMAFTAPVHTGPYRFKVTVSDGRGGEAEYSESVTIRRRAAASEYEVGLTASESGHIIEGHEANSNSFIYAGDNVDNQSHRAFISFDIGPLAGAEIREVELRLARPRELGIPSNLHQGTHGLWVAVVHWGARPLQLADYGRPSVGISSYTDYDITLRSITGEGLPGERMATELQRAIDEGKNRFQFRLQFAQKTNNDNQTDAVWYGYPDITLSVLYER